MYFNINLYKYIKLVSLSFIHIEEGFSGVEHITAKKVKHLNFKGIVSLGRNPFK